MLLYNRVFKDHSCGGMIAYAGGKHEDVPGLMRNQLGRIVTTDI